ncbi:transcription factor E2F3 [Pholidichthys leucotaenia]
MRTDVSSVLGSVENVQRACAENGPVVSPFRAPTAMTAPETAMKLQLSEAGLQCTPLQGNSEAEGQWNAEGAQAKRRLELEGSDPKDPQDGGGTPKAKKPMASLTNTKRKIDGQKHSLRYDTSLCRLTQSFSDLLHHSADGVLDLNAVSQELNVPKRRVYDVTNVLQGIQLIKKKSKSQIQWVNPPMTSSDLSLVEEEKKLDKLIQCCKEDMDRLCEDGFCQRYAYLTYEDVQTIPYFRDQTVIVIKAPAETKLAVPHPEESFQVHLTSTLGPINVYICSSDPHAMEVADGSKTDSAHAIGSHFNLTTNETDSHSSLPTLSHVFSEDGPDSSSGIDSLSDPSSGLTQLSPPVIGTSSNPTATSLKPHSEDQQNFVNHTPPLAFTVNVASEGTTDLYSSFEREQSSNSLLLIGK